MIVLLQKTCICCEHDFTTYSATRHICGPCNLALDTPFAKAKVRNARERASKYNANGILKSFRKICFDCGSMIDPMFDQFSRCEKCCRIKMIKEQAETK